MFNSELQKIKKQIQQHFRFLFESGFRFSSARMQKEHMGYWEVVLQSDDLLLQIYNDRGEIMLSISPAKSNTDAWYGLGMLIYFITEGERFIGYYNGDLLNKDLQLERLSSILKEYMNEIRDVMKNIGYNKQKLQIAYDKFLELSRAEYSKSRASELSKYVPKRKASR